MNGFTADWLDLRAGADTAARDANLVAAVRARLEANGPRPTAARIIDLATGTGANFRYLAPRLAGPQHWLLVDQDAALLDALGQRTAANAIPNCRTQILRLNLATELDALPLQGCDLVTASALLDLASARWLEALAGRCAAARAAVLFALTYDGRTAWVPREPDDELVRDLVNRHQARDKGFGPALGPAAGRAAARCLADLGYEVRQAASDWNIGPKEGVLQETLVAGWTAAAAEVAPTRASALGDWARRRRAHVAAGRSTLVVGHVDLAGWPR